MVNELVVMSIRNALKKSECTTCRQALRKELENGYRFVRVEVWDGGGVHFLFVDDGQFLFRTKAEAVASALKGWSD